MTTHRAVPSVVIVVLVTVALSSVAVTVVGLRRDTTPSVARAAEAPPVVDPQPEVEALAVLASWDARRAEAWAAGDVRSLRALYTPGSVAGERDVAMLRRWLARGLSVHGMVTQVVELHEVARSADQWVLSVTDRLAGGVAVGQDSEWRLPRDAVTSRTVTMRRIGAQWRVSTVG